MTEAEILKDATPATRGFLANVLKRASEGMSRAVRDALQPLNTRLSNVEVKLGAAVMTMASRQTKTGDPTGADVASLTAKLEKSVATVASLEHRLSRHADHLQSLESRLKKLEHK